MKLPLQYQVTEYDCALSALLNAVNYLYDIEKIPPYVIKIIHEHVLDGYDGKVEHIGLGTSRNAMKKISDELNKSKFSLSIAYFEKELVTLELIRNTILNKGVVIYRTFESIYEHYALITNIDENNVYIFDSYYPGNYDKFNKNIKVDVNPLQYNRVVSINQFIKKRRSDFSLGPINYREALLFRKMK
jgi:hypothetical protein